MTDQRIRRKAVLAKCLQEAWLNLVQAEEIARELRLGLRVGGVSKDSEKYLFLATKFSRGLPEKERARAEALSVVHSVAYARDMLYMNAWEHQPRKFLPRKFNELVKKAGEKALSFLRRKR